MANTYISINLASAGGGSDDRRLKVSSDDAVPAFLEEKVEAGSTKITIATTSPGADEKLQIDVDQTLINHDALLNYDVAQHREINDAGTSATEMWSSTKIQAELDAQDDASEITYTPSTLADWDGSSDPGNINGGLDQLADRVTTNETDIGTNTTSISDHIGDAVDAHDASAISNVPSGNLAATEQQAANNELQTDIDTRATVTALTNHNAATVAHGTSGDIVGTSDSQTITNKVINADNNTISEIVVSNFKAGVLDIDLSTVSASHDTISSAKAIKAYADIAVSGMSSGSTALAEAQTGTDVTGLSYTNGTDRSFVAHISVSIDATADLHEEFEIHGVQTSVDWQISIESTGDDTGVEFNIDNVGQVTYDSITYAGFTSGTIKFKADLKTSV